MELFYKKIVVKKKKICNGGFIRVEGPGLYVICGNNGSGKTLLLKNIFDNNKKKSVYISQDNKTILKKTDVINNITMCDQSQEKCLFEVLSKYGLSDLLSLNPKYMSGGEKRIVSILRGCLAQRDVLLIDEPTNDLDYDHVEMLIELLQSIKLKKVVIVISHDDRIIDIADCIYAINNYELVRNDCGRIFSSNSVLHECEEVEDHEEYDLKEKEQLKKITKGIWSIRFINYIIIFSFVIVSIFSVNSRVEYKKTETAIYDNQINIYSSISLLGRSVVGALSVNLIKFYSEKGFDYIGNYREDTVLTVYENTTLGKMRSNSTFEVFFLEFYDYKNREYVYLDDIYINEILGLEEGGVYLDFSDYFYYAMEEECDNVIKFDRSVYEESLNYIMSLEDRNYAPTYAVLVVHEGLSLLNVFENEDFKEALDSTLFWQSKESVDIYDNINEFKSNKYEIYNLLLCNMMLLLLGMIYYIMLIYTKRDSLSILYHYGFRAKDVDKEICRFYNDIPYRFVAIMIFGGWIIYHFGGISTTNIIMWAVIAASELCDCIIMRCCFFCYTKKIFSWKYR